MKKLSRSFWYTLSFIVILAILIIGLGSKSRSKTKTETLPSPSSKTIEPSPLPSTQDKEPDIEKIPAKTSLVVPFLVQAPFANWDALHEDACEEASLLMIYHLIQGTPITPQSGEKEIQAMVKWEEEHNYGPSLTVQELNQVAKDYLGLKTGRVETKITIDDIKGELAAKHPVIVPAAGKILPNPNFRGGGPNYHMLVIKGYDQNGFITNDPGTRKGEGFRYRFNDLYGAIHDFDPNNILNGQKAYLVFE